MSGSEELQVNMTDWQIFFSILLTPVCQKIICLPTCKAVCEVGRLQLILKMSFPRGYFVTWAVPRLSTGQSQSQCFIWSGNGSNIKQGSFALFKLTIKGRQTILEIKNILAKYKDNIPHHTTNVWTSSKFLLCRKYEIKYLGHRKHKMLAFYISL